MPLELSAGAVLSLGAGLADFAGDPPLAQKMRSSHIHTCSQGVVKFCPSCIQVVFALPQVLSFKNELTRTDKIHAHFIETHDPPAFPCTFRQSAAFLAQVAVLEPLPHDLQDDLGILWCAYSSYLPAQQSHVVGFRNSKSKQMKKK